MSISKIPNPIIPGFNPDPSVIRVGEDYFLATSTFEYFPGVPIFHSKDLVNWNIIGHALNRPSQLLIHRVDSSGGIYAPTLRYNKGRFYMATACIYARNGNLINESRGFYVWTDDIFDETKWSEPVYFDAVGIDQDLFFDDDGKVYLSVSRVIPARPGPNDLPHAVIMANEIELETGKSLGRPVILRKSTGVGRCTEGPHIYKKDGWYYLLVAEGGTELNHQSQMARSKSPLGPYEDPEGGLNPFLFQGEDNKNLINTGHSDLVQDTNGNWWAFFLGSRLAENGLAHLGRETFFCPVEWKEGEWPVFNGGKLLERTIETTLLPPQKPFTGWRDDFTGDKLANTWYNLRTPHKQEWSLSERPGSLTIRGNAYTIRDSTPAALLLQKQQYLSGTWETELDFQPSTSNEEAGSTVFWSNTAFAAIIVKKGKEDGSRVVVLRWTDIDSEEDKILEKEYDIPSTGPVVLRIVASANSYTFNYQLKDSSKPVELGELSTAVVQRKRPFDSPFTGTLLGLFAQGVEGYYCLDPAHFAYVSFTP